MPPARWGTRALVATLLAWVLPTRCLAEDDITLPPPLPPEPFVAFFPSFPPSYGAPAEPTGTRQASLHGRPLTAPDELADFVGEYFYPPLGTRLFNHSLPAKLKTRLDAYRVARNALCDELQIALMSQRNADPAAREQAMAALARTQTPRILALETEAEALRHDLVAGGLFTGAADWDAVREWRVGAPGLTTSPVAEDAEAGLVRAAPFYFDGLGVEQRGLLRELLLEFIAKSRGVHGMRPAMSGPDRDTVFFLPATARMRLPDPLPAELRQKLARFNALKFTLERELLTTLFEHDQQSTAKRTAALDDLSHRQWPRISDLEALAEEIRLALDRGGTARPWLPPLPSALMREIDAYQTERRALLAALTAALRVGARPVDLSPRTGNVTSDERLRRIREQAQIAAEARRQASAQFQLEHADEIAALNQRYAHIRAEAGAVAAGQINPATGQPMTTDALLAAYDVAMARFETIGREEAMYLNYRFAMLEPGLSPPQRRLLLRAAHAGLALPLPSGETVPVARPPRVVMP